jgi:hypothetical protein
MPSFALLLKQKLKNKDRIAEKDEQAGKSKLDGIVFSSQ